MTMQFGQPLRIKPERIDPAFLPPSYYQQLQQQQQIQQQLQQQQQQQQQLRPRMVPPNILAPPNVLAPPNILAQQPQQNQQTLQVTKPAPPPASESKENDENIENLPDFQSIKGVFGWTTIDDVNIPYIFRHDKQFVSVRIVEMKLLSRYPNSYPDDLGKHAPLTSFFVTANEAKLLNEINQVHCAWEYGKKDFSTKDLIVLVTDFIAFFKLVKKTFPDADGKAKPVEPKVTAGWVQIKNTVSPYVSRSDGKYVPLSVIQYAAGLLTHESVKGMAPTKQECDALNTSCQSAGVEFVFSDTTRLIKLRDIARITSVDIKELPSSDPLKHAQFEAEAKLKTVPANQPRAEKPKQVHVPVVHGQTAKVPTVAQPYRFQPGVPGIDTPSRHLLVNKLNAPTNDVRPDQYPLPRYPGPHPAMFDPNFSNMYGVNPRFPSYGQPNGYPTATGAPNMGARPNYIPHVPVSGLNGSIPPAGISPLNPLAQYYSTLMQQQTLPKNVPPPSLRNDLPQMNGVNGPTTVNQNGEPSKSPGATPSPRSRPPSTSRPPSGNRPPGGSPISPSIQNPQSSPRYINPGQNTPQQSQFPFGQTSLAHLQSMYGQRFPGPLPSMPILQTSSSLTTHTITAPVNPVVSHSVSALHKLTNSTPSTVASRPVVTSAIPPHLAPKPSVNISQGIPGLYSPQRRVSPPAPPPAHAPKDTITAPPPLQMMPTSVQVSTIQKTPPVTVVPTTPTTAPKTVQSPQVTPSQSHVPPAPENPTKPSPTPQTAAAAPTDNSPPLTDAIKGAWLNHKSISCLHLDKPDRNGRYCLVEAVCKLYFNGCSVSEFLFALESVLSVPLLTCNDAEEKAFIQYYSLPVNVLKCNKMVKFDDLENFFPQLSYMFPDKSSQDAQDGEPTEAETSLTMNGEGDGVTGIITNGQLSAEELEGAMPMTISQIKRAGELALGPVQKMPRLTTGDDADEPVIILD